MLISKIFERCVYSFFETECHYVVQIHNPASDSQLLGLQACTAMPILKDTFLYLLTHLGKF
jgi:hypothetical protein